MAYMSPEQARGEELDRRSDLFSLGAVLYEMATGRLAFGGGTTAVVFEAILNRTPLAASRVNPELIPDLGWITAKLLEKDRKLRYQSAAELQADLKRVKRDTESSGVPTFTPTRGLEGHMAQTRDHCGRRSFRPAAACRPAARIAGAIDC